MHRILKITQQQSAKKGLRKWNYDQFIRQELKVSGQEENGRKLFRARPEAKISLRGGNCTDSNSQFINSDNNDKYSGIANNGLETDINLEPGLEKVKEMKADRGKYKGPN